MGKNEIRNRLKVRNGLPHLTTRTAKQSLQQAFDEIGGVEKFAEWGKKHPTEFYKLWARLIPTEMSGGDSPVSVVITRKLHAASAQDSTDK